MKLNRTLIGLGLALALLVGPYTYTYAAAVPAPAAAAPAEELDSPGTYIVHGTSRQAGQATASQEMLVTLAEDMITARATILYNFSNAPTSELRLSVPEGYIVMDVKGEGVTVSKVSAGVLTVKLAKPVTGGLKLVVELEKARSRAEGNEALPELSTAGLARESGFVAVQVAPGLAAEMKKSTRLNPIDPSELPDAMRNGDQPLLYSYSFSRHPYTATFAIAQHEQVSTLNAAIDTANLVSVLTPEGRLLTRGIYEVRNNRKQYLELSLPDKAEIWSVYVNERPVIASTDGKGRFFLPLVLPGGAAGDGSFTVEVIYYLTIHELKKKGDLKTMFPKTDLPISEMLVSLYLPPRYKFGDFEGTMERIELDELDDQVAASPDVLRKDRDEARNQGQNSSFALSRQTKMENEIAEEARYKMAQPVPPSPAAEIPTPGPAAPGVGLDGQDYNEPLRAVAAAAPGALPVKFSVPLRGQLFRFSKLVVVNETPELRFDYRKTWKKPGWLSAGGVGKVVIWALLVALLAAVVRRVWPRPRPMTPAAVVPAAKTAAASNSEPAPSLEEMLAVPPLG